ncbi:Cof-type HAD-IIB family hydrolase [Fructilactobacillus sanfranciscensis]|uniref:Cof-type HAD-IIB family hydrolase n=1 Tax=Fructilactobacillus sanfranciscensis TaxID=1625 RepID=UPI0011184B4D|nr:Cof-type HAD-IIB family hydrolase [Fructilactobacillus sanfranciscensis]MCG7195393.1 HAD family phosphatase [Fructilactobacillus sanfranciscensis]TNL01405.1 HAD family phosphatase [Fructilactobacillus sanfranciscensis]
MIKMIALDLDNTLLTSDKTISKVNENELKKLHQAGIKVVLCTGRPINAIWKFIEQLGLDDEDDYTITFNGGLVVHNRDKAELSRTGMSKKQLEPLFTYAKEKGYPLDILDFKQVYPMSELNPSIYHQMLAAKMDFIPTKFNDLSDKLYSKAIMATTPKILDEVVANMPKSISENYHIVRSQDRILEFLPANSDKAAGLEKLLHHFGWDFSNLMAFGDAENDAGMLEHAEVGVAMENAIPAIKKIANAETLSNDQDGVAVFLKNYFKTLNS